MAEHSSPWSQGQRPQPVWLYPVVSLFLWAVILIIFFRFFAAGTLVLLGIIAAAAVAAMLRPLAKWIPGPRGLSAAVLGLGFLAAVMGVLVLMGWLMVEPVQRWIADWPQLQKSLDAVLSSWSTRFGMRHPVTVQDIGNQIMGFFSSGNSLGQVFSQTANLTAAVLVGTAFVFIGSIYLLAEPPGRLSGPLLAMLPPWRRAPAAAALADLDHHLRWWLVGTLISIAVVGVASMIGYSIIGLEFALPLAIFAGLAEAVPTIGPAITLGLALLLSATQGPTQTVGVVIVYGVVQTLESYLLIPLVMRKAVSIPPVITLFTIVLWGKIFGVAGLLLAIPIDMLIWSFVDHLLVRPNTAERAPPRELPAERSDAA